MRRWLCLSIILIVAFTGYCSCALQETCSMKHTGNSPKCGNDKTLENALFLSANCTRDVIKLSVTENPGSLKDLKTSIDYPFYAVEYECFSLKDMSRVDELSKYTSCWISDVSCMTLMRKVNTSEDLKCIFRACVNDPGPPDCWHIVKNEDKCVIQDQSTLSLSSSVQLFSTPTSEALLLTPIHQTTELDLNQSTLYSSSSQWFFTPTSEALGLASIQHTIVSDPNQSTIYSPSQLSSTPTLEALLLTTVLQTSTLTKNEATSSTNPLSEIIATYSKSLSETTIDQSTKEVTNQVTFTSPASGTVSSDTASTSTIVVSMGVVVAFFVFALLCVTFLLMSLMKRKGSIRFALPDNDTKSTLKDDEASVTIHKFDDISITESIVTISQSLEIVLPIQVPVAFQDTMRVSKDLSFTPHHRIEDLKEELDGASVSLEHSDSRIKPTQTIAISSETSIVRSPCTDGYCQKTSSNLNNEDETLSIISSSTGGYVLTSNNEAETGNPLQCVEPHNDIPNKEILHSCSCSPTNDAFTDFNPQSCCYTNDNYLRSLSEGYVTDSERGDYIANPDISTTEFVPCSSKGFSMQNAQVNDYIFQKKIDNRLLFPLSPSSGYYSGCTSDYASSYLPESDRGYLPVSSDCESNYDNEEKVLERNFPCDLQTMSTHEDITDNSGRQVMEQVPCVAPHIQAENLKYDYS